MLCAVWHFLNHHKFHCYDMNYPTGPSSSMLETDHRRLVWGFAVGGKAPCQQQNRLSSQEKKKHKYIFSLLSGQMSWLKYWIKQTGRQTDIAAFHSWSWESSHQVIYPEAISKQNGEWFGYVLACMCASRKASIFFYLCLKKAVCVFLDHCNSIWY